MAKSVFKDKAIQPDSGMVSAILGSASPVWDDLVAHVLETYPAASPEWKYYGAAWGWSLVLNSKKKKLVFLTPASGQMICSFILNDKGRELALASGLSDEIMEIIRSGKDNPAGHAFDIPVFDAQTLELAKQLFKIKAAS